MTPGLDKQSVYWDEQVGSFDSIYSGEKSKLGTVLDSIFRWDMYKRFEYTMEKSQPIRDRTFLDVGCGTGRYALEFALREARAVEGIDISEKMIEVCKQRALEEGLDDRCTFIQTDLLEYQPEAKFDVCIGIGLFDYIKDPLPVITKMRECVTDSVIMSFPRLWTWRAPVRKARLALRRCDVYFYTSKQLRDYLSKAGFERSEVQTIGQLYCVTAYVK